MKKCPSCQKTFDDDKRFCQVDGTPLVAAVEPGQEDESPFKTVVVGKQDLPIMGASDDPMKTTVMSAESKEDDILQIPEVFDPMKTMVVSEPIKFEKPTSPPVSDESSLSSPQLPKFNEPNLSPPTFGDLAANEPPKVEPPTFEPPKFEPLKAETPVPSPFNEPPKFNAPIANPFSEPPKVESPFSAPIKETPKPFDPPKIEPTPLPNQGSPFSAPKNEPISSPFENKATQPPPSPFESTPFQAKEPVINQPLEKTDWNPPAPPNQTFGTEMPIQQAVSNAGGQNKTLGMVSLVLGIVSFVCLLGVLASIPAVITGYLQKGKIKSNPTEYGGGGLATGGMILGIANILLSILAIIGYVLLVIGLINF